jgi:hypothetical protein
MKNWKAALVFLCIFLSGAVAGGFVGLRIGCEDQGKAADAQKKNQPRPRRPIDDWTKRRFAEFKKRLNITAEQQAKLEPLFLNAQAELRRLREKSFDQTTEIMDRLDAEVASVLTDAQKSEFARMIKERQVQFEKAAAERAAGRGPRAGGQPPAPSGGPHGEAPPPPSGPSGENAPTPPPPQVK